MAFSDICMYNRPSCPNEWATLRFGQNTCGEADVSLRDVNGDPIVLQPYSDEIVLTAKEMFSLKNSYFSVRAPIIDVDEAAVHVDIDQTDIPDAGLWLGEFIVARDLTASSSSSSSSSTSSNSSSSTSLSSTAALVVPPINLAFPGKKILYRIRCLIEVAENITHQTGCRSTAISIAEIRMAMRDRCAEDNFLLEDVEFSDTEIAWALRRPIDWWNEQPPPIETYTPATFPFRYNYLDAVLAELYRMASIHQERNNLRYSAAGVTVDDSESYTRYKQISDELMARWQTWAIRKKRSMNYEKFYGRTEIQAFGAQNIHITGNNDGFIHGHTSAPNIKVT